MTLQSLITDIYYTLIESLLIEEQNAYSQYVLQRILVDLNAKIRVKIKK